jgi:hypothetical protein
LFEDPEGFPVEPDEVGSYSILTSTEFHLDNDLVRSLYGAFLSHSKTELGFGGLIALFTGTTISFGILQISLIHEESDKLTVLLAIIAISHPPLFSYLG